MTTFATKANHDIVQLLIDWKKSISNSCHRTETLMFKGGLRNNHIKSQFVWRIVSSKCDLEATCGFEDFPSNTAKTLNLLEGV